MAKAKEGITWQAAVIDIDRDAEFSGDDVDRYSSLVDLGRECTGVVIDIPAIDSAAVSVYAQVDGEEDTVPLAVHYRQASDNATAVWSTTAGTGGLFIHCDFLGAVRYIRLYTGANQTADRTFYVLGTV